MVNSSLFYAPIYKAVRVGRMKMTEAITYEDLIASPILYRNILGLAMYERLLIEKTPEKACGA